MKLKRKVREARINNNQREARLTRRRNACGISNIFIDVQRWKRL